LGNEIEHALLGAQAKVELGALGAALRRETREQRLKRDLRARLRLDALAAFAIGDVVAPRVAAAAQVPRGLRSEHQRGDARLVLVEPSDDLVGGDAAAREGRALRTRAAQKRTRAATVEVAVRPAR